MRVGLRPTASISTREPGQRRGGDEPEGGGREVAGHGERPADAAAAHPPRTR